jgi:class 3 adenylate cyclase
LGNELETWLRTIGLQERISAFRMHAIEIGQLADLSESDLFELGLTIGERKRFRRALTDHPPANVTCSRTIPEHRPLTVLFVDLVGSSALGELLEREDLLDVIQTYREFCGEAIVRFGGMIAQTVGDGILAYFSYPVAHENDPERAIRAALTIARNVPKLATAVSDPLQVHVGAATGRVLISDVFAGGRIDRRAIVGSTPNLAQRMQSLAGPGEVIIADETYDRVHHLFTCESLGEFNIRGFSETRKVWRRSMRVLALWIWQSSHSADEVLRSWRRTCPVEAALGECGAGPR